jgi:hypothetical protein
LPGLQVEPTVVVEVEVDNAYERARWRHGVRFRRVRAELQASDVALARG